MYGKSILGQWRPLLLLRIRSSVVPALYRQVLSRTVSTRSTASKTTESAIHINPEPFTPPPVIQRAVSSLLNDAFKNGTFSWDYIIASCLSVMLYSLAHKELHNRSSNSAIIRHVNQLEYRSVSLHFNQARMFASINFSTSRRQQVCHLVEHTNPHYNSTDIVKLLYIHASRTGAIKTPLPNERQTLVWSHPERVVLPHMPNSLDQTHPAMRPQPMARQSEYVWHLAALAAKLHVPGPEYNTIGSFLTSALPDHCTIPDLSVLVPQLRSDPQDFVNVLLKKRDAPIDEREKCRQKWLLRLASYHCCPFACGYSTGTIQALQVHTRTCGYRSEEAKASTLEKEAAKTVECPHCESRFHSGGAQRKHIRRVHQRYEPFLCSVPGCGSKFSELGRWNSHFQRMHQWPALKCPLCDKEQLNLQHHLRHSHSDVTQQNRIALLQYTRSKLRPSHVYRDFYHKLDLKPVPPILLSPLSKGYHKKKPVPSASIQTLDADCNHTIPIENQ